MLESRRIFALWVVSGVALVLFLDRAPVQRTQEARVMETAREMLGRPTRDWLIPKLNREVRLRKPPLAYWLSAAGFEVFGVKAWAARLPMALAGWLTIGITYAFAARAFDRFTGLLASAALLGSLMFYRYTRLAETDALAMLFVTLSIFAIWRGGVIWFHVAAASAALAMMSKGAPAVFPLIFLIALSAAERSSKRSIDFLLSGALVTFAIIALPWWIYVARAPESKQISQELSVLLTGENHGRPVWDYFPQVLIATLPWTPMVIIGIVLAAKRWKTDARLRTLLIWSLAIFIPLCIPGNKQRHYLLPLMPPLMILAGWAIANTRSEIRRGLVPFLAVSIVGMIVFVGVIFPRSFERNPRIEANQILEKFPQANFYFTGGNESLPLCFAMQREIPILRSDDETLAAAQRDADAVFIVLEKPDRPASAPPAPLVEQAKIESEERVVRLFALQSRGVRSLSPTSSTVPSLGGK